MTMSSRASLYWHTLRHLRPSQVAYQLRRRAFPQPFSRPGAAPSVSEGLKSQPFASPLVPPIGLREISFLNQTRPLDVPRMDWASPDCPKLWRYNLHYFDYLHWPVYETATKQQLINSWIAHCRPGMPDAWEPYPVSLRIVNWIKFWLGGVTPAQNQLDSVASQLSWLEKNLEYHLLANHLLKNGKALVFGGLFFEGPDAARWLAKGLQILVEEADEQILPDGGHFERSPMYHCIVLEDLLDVVNLVRSNPGIVDSSAEATLTAAASRARDFLVGIRAGDGRIPLFNDSAFGIAPEPASLLNYAGRVLGDFGVAPEGAPTGITIIRFPQTGYFGYRQGGESLIVDCGAVGPDYQPGHAHCDTLSYELCVAGQRVVVDAGVCGYEADEMRHYARRTSSHNTVVVDGAEQSEIWGAFRVARRAYPLSPALMERAGGRLEFSGAHDGYRRLTGSPEHQRRIRMGPGGPWEVFDLITGSPGRNIRAANYVHLGCDLQVTAAGPGIFALQHPESGLRLRLSVTCGSEARLESGYHFPEFGLRRDNKIISIQREAKLPFEMHYRIERL